MKYQVGTDIGGSRSVCYRGKYLGYVRQEQTGGWFGHSSQFAEELKSLTLIGVCDLLWKYHLVSQYTVHWRVEL